MGALILISFALGLWIGWTLVPRLMSPLDPPAPKPEPNPKHESRILKPFAQKQKRQPKVNNDQKAWLIENQRDV